jgi:ribonucleoside-diphosphate reductase alpha chain
VPGERRQQLWPSTVAYIARLVIHRYAMLGVLDAAGFPLNAMGILQIPARGRVGRRRRADRRRALPRMRQPHADPQGRLRVCTTCGYIGACG